MHWAEQTLPTNALCTGFGHKGWKVSISLVFVTCQANLSVLAKSLQVLTKGSRSKSYHFRRYTRGSLIGRAKECRKRKCQKDAVALRMAETMIKVDEIFDDGRRAVV
jgi:hypothetical protein